MYCIIPPLCRESDSKAKGSEGIQEGLRVETKIMTPEKPPTQSLQTKPNSYHLICLGI